MQQKEKKKQQQQWISLFVKGSEMKKAAKVSKIHKKQTKP